MPRNHQKCSIAECYGHLHRKHGWIIRSRAIPDTRCLLQHQVYVTRTTSCCSSRTFKDRAKKTISRVTSFELAMFWPTPGSTRHLHRPNAIFLTSPNLMVFFSAAESSPFAAMRARLLKRAHGHADTWPRGYSCYLPSPLEEKTVRVPVVAVCSKRAFEKTTHYQYTKKSSLRIPKHILENRLVCRLTA